WAHEATRRASYLLHGQTVVIVGFGSIGRRLCELLAAFGLAIVGLRRHPRGDEPVPTYPLAPADEHLPRAAHAITLLPAAEGPARFFDHARLAAIRPGAVFYNIGRGSTVDQNALTAALTSGALRAAYLDVVAPEPLPASDPLWSLPTCVITPH